MDAAKSARVDGRPWLWLLVGVVLLAVTQVRAGIGVLAWVAPLPWLRYLRITTGVRSRLSFSGILFLAWTLATAKIASEPMFLALAPVFALLIALTQLGAYLTWDALRRRVTPRSLRRRSRWLSPPASGHSSR